MHGLYINLPKIINRKIDINNRNIKWNTFVNVYGYYFFIEF